MAHLKDLYRSNLSLLTDLYQLTMAQGYFDQGVGDRQATFNLFFRRNPFGGGYSIAAGLETVLEFLEGFQFSTADLSFLKGLTGNDGAPLFSKGFLEHLSDLRLSCDVHAVPEGTVVFPHQPLIRVTGPIIEAQILETALLTIINFQTLIATKAARICYAAEGDPVLEFGLRRAQGIDGGLMASRAACIGGCAGTSNVLAAKTFDLPVKGTHAHSWVCSFGSEREAFDAYADAMPNNCVFLVDTYDTIKGVKTAIEVSRDLREKGHEVVGIRLDSGDLAYLSIEARKMLDTAGFEDASIVASNSLDETTIQSLKQQGAEIDVWGVGTKLATAYDQPALGGVYKLAEVYQNGWKPKIKLSEQRVKISNPGALQTRRFYHNGGFVGDMIYNVRHAPVAPGQMIIDPMDDTRRKVLEGAGTDLLEKVIDEGARVSVSPTIPEIQERVQDQLSKFHDGIKRFQNPHEYPVGLSRELHDLKTNLILEARGF